MEVVLSGASGRIGIALRQELAARGDTVTALSRFPDEQPHEEGIVWINWEGLALAVAGADVVVHLAGASIATEPLTEARIQEVRDSRIERAKEIVALIRAQQRKPTAFVSASAGAHYAGSLGDEFVDEDSPTDATGPMGDLCRDWEVACQDSGVRTVILRYGIVLTENQHPIQSHVQIAAHRKRDRFGGGPVDKAQHWISWIHMDDAVGITLRAIDNTSWNGVYNVVSPNPVRSAEYTRSFEAALPPWRPLRAPRFVRQLLYRRPAGPRRPSTRSTPKRALAGGYQFRWPEIAPAWKDLES